MNWYPQHFPVGTVFVLNDDFAHNVGYVKDRQFTVTEVYERDAVSWCVCTGVMIDVGRFQHELMFHTSHVKAVIKRGDGPVRIRYWADQFKDTLAKDFEQVNVSPLSCPGLKKRNYNLSSIRYILLHCLRDRPELFSRLNTTRLFAALGQQSWDKGLIEVGGPHFLLHAFNRKRFNKWFKQNLNRFLYSTKELKRLQQKYEAEDLQRYYDDLEHDLDAQLDAKYADLPEEDETETENE